MRTLVLTTICVVLNGAGFVTYKAVSAPEDARIDFPPLPIIHDTKAAVVGHAAAVAHETPPVAPPPIEEPPPVEPLPVVVTPAKPVVRRVVVRQVNKPVEPLPAKPVTKQDAPAAEQKAEDPLLKMEANPYKRKD